MITNKKKLLYLKKQLDSTGKEIEFLHLEKELKKRAKEITKNCPTFIPEVFDFDPLRKEKLCDYYIFLFAEFENLKQSEYKAKKEGTSAHETWLNQPSEQVDEKRIQKMIKQISEKIAISGITAGLIWLGKTIIENWPFGYHYIDNKEEN